MSTSLTIGSTGANVSWQYDNVLTYGNSTLANGFSFTNTLANGTAAGQADLIYISSTTLAASTAVNVDLAGSLTDVYGNTITMARVKAIYFQLMTTTAASSVSVGGHATAALANWITSADTLANDQPAIKVLNGGCFYLSAGATSTTGYAVTATTADLLKILNNDSGNVATYKLVVFGCSA